MLRHGSDLMRPHNCLIYVAAALMSNGEWHCKITVPAKPGFTVANERFRIIKDTQLTSPNDLFAELATLKVTKHVDFYAKAEKVSSAMLEVYSKTVDIDAITY